MTRENFWTIVESVNWAELTLRDEAPRDYSQRSYNLGKKALIAALPTMEDVSEFEEHFLHVSKALCNAFEAYVAHDHEARTTDLGDDSYGDLVAHIVGLGQKEYELHLQQLNLVTSRGRQYLFAESFSYRIPHEEDYDPTSLKLAREVYGLLHWQAELVRNPESRTAKSEVVRRGKACDVLRELLLTEGGVEMTSEEFEVHLEARREARREASDAAFAAACAKREAKEAAKAKLLADFENNWS